MPQYNDEDQEEFSEAPSEEIRANDIEKQAIPRPTRLTSESRLDSTGMAIPPPPVIKEEEEVPPRKVVAKGKSPPRKAAPTTPETETSNNIVNHDEESSGSSNGDDEEEEGKGANNSSTAQSRGNSSFSEDDDDDSVVYENTRRTFSVESFRNLSKPTKCILTSVLVIICVCIITLVVAYFTIFKQDSHSSVPSPFYRGNPSVVAPTTRPVTPPPTKMNATPGPNSPRPTTQAPVTKAPTTAAPARPTATPGPTTRGPTNGPTLPPTKAPSTQGPTTKAPSTQGPTTNAPSTQGPTTRRPTLPPVAAPTAPTASLEASIRDYLFQVSGVSATTPIPAVQKALTWLVDEAVSLKALAFPLDEKYLQRFGVLVLYFSLDPNVAATNSDTSKLPNVGLRQQDACLWTGMKCNDNSRLTRIKLANRQLPGKLPAEMDFFFPKLKSIDLSKNQLTGSIPEGLFDCLEMEELYLYKNQLSGTISSKIGNLWSLRRFQLSHNQLTGPIPPELKSTEAKPRIIRVFNVHRNQMSGPIPAKLNWRQLLIFDVGRNQFSGTLPVDFGTNSTRLRHLYLDYNNFEGTFPSEVLNAGDGRLNTLVVNNNQFSGVFPSDHLYNNTLVEMTIQKNKFTGMGEYTCQLDVFSGGELVEFKSNCLNCRCGFGLMCQHCAL